MMHRVVGLLTLVALISCGGPKESNQDTEVKEEKALIHSFARPSEAKVKHLNLIASVDFENRVLNAKAHYDIETSDDAQKIVFDTRNLSIAKVFVDSTETKDWWIGPKVEFLGQALEITITPQAKRVSIEYVTTDGAEALQWLNPQQTAGKVQPFLFTQSQAILARTWIPCQDSPGIRYTYEATITVPSGLMALMSASNPTEIDSSGVYHFEMNQPIPSYLMALAVGDLVFQSVGANTGVYAEPSMIEATAFEFEDMQKMLESAESIYGKYAWDQYDVLLLPPSFPFGGMENPRLTFATPTILAGDKSLTALVAHELAHSWSGNLVTNRTWDDFWLNEGFTVYFERRIMEDVYGKEYADMLTLLGRQDLDKELKALADSPDDTHLKLDLEGRDPDDGMSDIAYEKGYFFLRTMEENVGRGKFDQFLNEHFSDNAFQTIITEEFLTHLKEDLLLNDEAKYKELKIDEWVYGPGLPDNCIEVSSTLFEQVNAQVGDFLAEDGKAAAIDTANWTTHQWLHFLRQLPANIGIVKMKDLDNRFSLTKTGNSEIAAEWFLRSIENSYSLADDAIEEFLIRVGRRKFLMPIYTALAEADLTKERATAIYAQARPNYHSVSSNSIDELLDYKGDGHTSK
ncbi:hydrolase/aminopeptidase [Salibacteraceae bacterium]|nr:hydrolase/aminopeptidase [Salibacteraceae bacterium]MDB4104602.1 hydrolase/aminopeptidase [Salibacteraceae bacterium]MDB9709418.1 hydrolase/aminopeptidase [Salibacteraceae bacterium]MDC1303937.1 hydrolase/aminopeptidase [Salibacteraceae bacterium]